MSKTALNIIKSWFLTDLKPTQAQFWNTWDSFWHKDQKIPTASINGLNDYLGEKADKQAFQAHLTDEAAHQALFDKKVDKVEGYGLSQEDYTTEEKQKLEGLSDHTQEIESIFDDLAEKQDIIVGEDGKILPEYVPDLAILDLLDEVAENSIEDFAANALNTDGESNLIYEFQKGDAVQITDAEGTVLHYIFKGGNKTDVNNYSLINATKVSWNNITGKPNLLTQPSTLGEVLGQNNTADNDIIVNKVVARFSPANPAKMVSELRATGVAINYDGTDVFQISRLGGNNQPVEFYVHDTENGKSVRMQLRPKIQGKAATFYGPVTGQPSQGDNDFTVESQLKTFTWPINANPPEVEVLQKNKHKELIQYDGTTLIRCMTHYWSSVLNDYSVGVGLGIGHEAMLNNSGRNNYGIGNHALRDNTGSDSVGIGNQALMTNSDLAIGIGPSAGRNNAGSAVVFIGNSAGSDNTGSRTVSIGYYAGFNNIGGYGIFVGTYAGRNNTGANTIAFGQNAAYSNTRPYCLFLGDNSGYNNIGQHAIGIGRDAFRYNTGDYGVAIGYNAGKENQGIYPALIGYNAGLNNIGNSITGVGASSLADNKGHQATALGYSSGRYNTALNLIAIGYNSGQLNYGLNNICIGSNVYANYEVDLYFDSSDVDIDTDRITVENHGYSTGLEFYVLYNTGFAEYTTPIQGISSGAYIRVKVMNSNTFQILDRDITNAGDGTNFQFRCPVVPNNVIVLGHAAKATKDNQIVLGNTTHEELFTYANIKLAPGQGIEFTSPDGTITKRWSIDNTGEPIWTTI